MSVFILDREQQRAKHPAASLVRGGSGNATIDSAVVESLVKQNWPPWFLPAFTIDTLEGMRRLFAQGQPVILENGAPIAALNTNRIDWDGNPDHMPRWDQLIGTF